MMLQMLSKRSWKRCQNRNGESTFICFKAWIENEIQSMISDEKEDIENCVSSLDQIESILKDQSSKLEGAFEGKTSDAIAFNLATEQSKLMDLTESYDDCKKL